MQTLLRLTRLSLGLKISEVAQAIKVDPSTISKLETGDRVPIKTVARALYDYYNDTHGRKIPLGAIYDVNHPKYSEAAEDLSVSMMLRAHK